jgi:5-methylcytosine-specific restriction endonuclease McrA
MATSFTVEMSEEEIRRERAKARELRQTRWWKQKLARGVCHYCGRHFPPEQLTMDHIVPIIRGGRSTKSNVAVVCKECNNTKKYLLPMEWEEYLKTFRRRDEAT